MSCFKADRFYIVLNPARQSVHTDGAVLSERLEITATFKGACCACLCKQVEFTVSHLSLMINMQEYI